MGAVTSVFGYNAIAAKDDAGQGDAGSFKRYLITRISHIYLSLAREPHRFYAR